MPTTRIVRNRRGKWWFVREDGRRKPAGCEFFWVRFHGRGAICDIVLEYVPTARIQVCEIQKENRRILQAKGYDVIAEDFFGLIRESGHDHAVRTP